MHVVALDSAASRPYLYATELDCLKLSDYSQRMDARSVAQVRGFNRTVAARIGTVGDGFLGRNRPYGESRILWEIGRKGAEVRELRSRLDLDSGYLSRVLRSLQQAGLINVKTSDRDGRVRLVELTRAGRAECAELDRRSDRVAWGILEPLSSAQRGRLLSAMNEVEKLLTASMVDIAVEDPHSRDAQWCIDQYMSELNERFEAGWDPSRSISADADELVMPRGLILVARLRGRPVGCGALKFHAGAPVELKRMWVSSDVRGVGLGRRLLGELERRAKSAGATIVRLETNRALQEAIHLYRTSGYHEVAPFNDEPYAHHWFEKRLT